MFGKLLKNDLKAQWHSMSTIFLCVMVVGIVAEAFTMFSKNRMISALGGLLVLFCLLVACIIILIAVGLLYNKTMFGRAGYLTLTLPVKTSSLIWSKTISGLIWIFTVYALFIAAIPLWLKQASQVVGEDAVSNFNNLLSLFGMPSFESIFIYILTLCIAFAVSVLLLVQCLYLGITCSNVKPFSKLGVVGAVIIFFLSFGVITSITTKISNAVPIGVVITPDVIKFTSNTVKTAMEIEGTPIARNLLGPILRLVISILLHFPIVYLTKNKVNIK